MTVAQAYSKYNEMKTWYDNKVGTFMNKIYEIDAKIKDLKNRMLTAVGAVLESIKRKINKFLEKIRRIIQAVQDFIENIEKKIEEWIKKKIEDIAYEIMVTQKKRAELKAMATAASVTGIPISLPEETDGGKADSSNSTNESTSETADKQQDASSTTTISPTNTTATPVPKHKSIMTDEESDKTVLVEETKKEQEERKAFQELQELAKAYSKSDDEETIGEIDNSLLKSEHFKLTELCYSKTADIKGINNAPTQQALTQLQALTNTILEPLVKKLGGRKFNISSGYRCQKLNSLINGAKNSQHVNGQAVDLYPTDGNYKGLILAILEIGQFDQLIWEHPGNSKWVHVSHKASGEQRLELLNYTGSYSKFSDRETFKKWIETYVPGVGLKK